VLAVLLAATYLGRRPVEQDGVVYTLPSDFGTWRGVDVSYNRDLLTSWVGTEHMAFKEYHNTGTGHRVTMYIAYYPDMGASDMTHAPEVCYPGQGWSITDNNTINHVLSGKTVRVKRMAVEKGDRWEVVYSWWQTRDRVIAENWQYRLFQVWNRLLKRDTASLWVRISAEHGTALGTISRAEEAIHAFCTDLSPLLGHYFLQESK